MDAVGETDKSLMEGIEKKLQLAPSGTLKPFKVLSSKKTLQAMVNYQSMYCSSV
jgi:hypothetical protein